MSEIYCWCVGCGVRLTKEEIKGWGCPKCGNQGIPCSPTKDVFVEINWHELHILCVWAENYARSSKEEHESMSRTVYAIARRLEHQWPTLGHLTLSGEIAVLPEDLAERGITAGPVESNVPPPKPFISIGPGAVGFSKRREDI